MIMLSRIRGTLSTILPLDSSDDQFSLDFDSLKLSTGSSSFPDIPNTSIDLTLNGASDFNPLENIDFSDDLNSFSLWPASAEGFNEIGNDDTLIIDELSQSQVPNIFNEPVEGDQFVPWNPDQFPPSSLIGDGIYASDYKPSGSCDHWKAGGYQEFLCCGGPVDFETDRVTMVESGDVKQAMATWIDNCVRRTYRILQNRSTSR